MLNISPMEDMPRDLESLLMNKGQDLRRVKSYAIISTTAPVFQDRVLVFALTTVAALTNERLEFISIAPGEWQPGAMQYLVYLIK